MSTAKAGATVKRKSTLSELGIKPGGPEPVKTTTKTTSTTRNSPSSPSVSRTRSVTLSTTTTTRTKAPPASIKTERGGPPSPSINSPTSPNPRRRSIVPTTSNQRASISPLARRASVNVTHSASSKRVASPAALESLEEVQTVKDQLNEKEQEIARLKTIELESETKISTLQNELEKLREELKVSLEANKQAVVEQNDTKKELLMQDTEDKLLETEDKLLKTEDMLLETENRLQQKHQAETEKLVDQQEKQLEALRTEHDEKIKSINSMHENQVQQLELKHREHIQTLQKDHESSIKTIHAEKESIISDLKEKMQLLQDSQSNSHIRKVENELDSALTALEEFKKSSQQEKEGLEQRYRDEIKQLQTGNDGTTEVWLEKTRAAQQELNKLHDEIQVKDREHEQALQLLRDQHSTELDHLHDVCDQKESQFEAQSHQIEDLVLQVEALQNSLEAATVRLENTAKSTTPTTSTTTTTATTTNTSSHDHQECLNRVDGKQKEIDHLQARLSELKESHEIQVKRLAQEKATALQELGKKSTSATPPQSPLNSSTTGEDRLIRIAEQHRNELRKMHVQYQTVVDVKNRDLEDYAYRVKAIVAAKQKEMENLETSNKETVDALERKVDNYEKESVKWKERVAHWEMLSHNNEVLIQDMKRECVAHKDENAQLASLVRQLQSEITH